VGPGIRWPRLGAESQYGRKHVASLEAGASPSTGDPACRQAGFTAVQMAIQRSRSSGFLSDQSADRFRSCFLCTPAGVGIDVNFLHYVPGLPPECDQPVRNVTCVRNLTERTY